VSGRSLLAALWIWAVLVSLPAFPVHAREVPALSGRVNDLAEVLSPDVERTLEGRLEAYEASTGHQLAVLTVASLDGDPIEDFAIRVVEAWKLGRTEADDGVLLLVAVDDRKMRIEVGYGLEGAIPDLLASRIIREVLTPAFRQGDFDGGISRALDLLQRAAQGEAVRLPGRGATGGPAPGISWLPLLFIVLMVVLRVVGGGSSALGRRGFRRGGFGYGGFGGGGFGGGGGGGGFSGGGGSFGGGGASGGW